MSDFWIISGFLSLSLFFALGVLLNRAMVPAVFSLFGFLLVIAGVYAALAAHAATFAQILLYVGGVMVLVAFVLFLNPEPSEKTPPPGFLRMHYGKSLLIILLVLISVLYIPFREMNAFFLRYKQENSRILTEKDLGETGKILATDFTFEFEMLGLLMLTALILCGWYLTSGRKTANP
jgi:NADH:ubiquinone oxidoreductase subunit 6 (subunit J)